MTTPPDFSPSELPSVEISQRAARRLAGGYLWIFSNEIEEHGEHDLPAYWCRFTYSRRPVALGYFNRHSLIAGRALGLDPEADPQRRSPGACRCPKARRYGWLIQRPIGCRVS
jgi:23S rRNA G2069 N7-methylase RlmK/C1962 C5-methylase RlmI